MLKAKGLLGTFWGEAISTMVFILNHASTQSVDGKTPCEAWHGLRPVVHLLRTFGCITHVKIMKPYLRKMDDRNRPMVFVVYECVSKAYRVYNPVSKRVHVTRGVIFDEVAQWGWSGHGEVDAVSIGEPFTVEYTTVYVPRVTKIDDMASHQ